MVLAEVFPGCSFVSSRKTQGVVNNTSLMRRADQAWGGHKVPKNDALRSACRGSAVCFSHGVFQQPAHDENRARNVKMTLS